MPSIRSLAAFPVRLRLREAYRISRAVQVDAAYVVVVARDETGRMGLGEAAPFPGESEADQGDILATIRDRLAPAVLGVEVMDFETLHARMEAAAPGRLFARAAIDLACHDLAGQALGVPVARLLGGFTRTEVPLSGGPIGLMAPREAAARARRLVAQGFRTIKVKIGAGLAADVALVGAVRRAVGPRVAIRLDANQAYTADQAVAILRRLEAFAPALIEQPVALWDLDGAAKVAAALDTPIMADEGISTPQDVLRVAEKRAADLVKIKVMRSGGLHPARKVCAVAEAAGLPVVLGSGHQSSLGVAAELHLAAALRAIPYAGEMVGHLRLREEVVARPIPVKGGAAAVPEGTGLGVALADRWRERWEREGHPGGRARAAGR